LTALLNVRNGEIKNNAAIQPLFRDLLKEISAVIEGLPELKDLPYDSNRFSTTTLETVMLDTVDKTAGNSSSMREDILKGRATEIEHMNGWIVKRGQELGVQCPTNSFVTQLILAKSSHTAS
jgi:2-dehydropantoate 2-reductase